jgi:hypothetical protein
MALMERLQERYPTLARALVVPSHIAPISSEVMAHDPGTRPLKIRYAT